MVNAWDKKLGNVYAVCHQLLYTHWIDTLIGDRFELWGWAETQEGAHCLVNQQMIIGAEKAGVLHDVRAIENDPDYTIDRTKRHAPTIFSIMKWISAELTNPPTLKWRDIINYSIHPLKHYAKLVSRSLHLLINRIVTAHPTCSLPNMLGVRDMVGAITRSDWQTDHIVLKERDMDDMFWQISRDQVKKSLKWAFQFINRSRTTKNLFFSLSKMDKAFDRIGKSTSEDFFILDVQMVERYLSWDLEENVLLTLDTTVMSQGTRGVPIRGFLSAQIAELWCIYKEHISIFNKRSIFPPNGKRILPK